MSEGKGTANPKKEDPVPKKEDPKKKVEVPKVVPVEDPILELKDVFAQFLISSKDNQSRNRTDIQELRDAIIELKKPDYLSPTRDEFSNTPLLNRSRGGRRSSMFLACPSFHLVLWDQQSTISLKFKFYKPTSFTIRNLKSVPSKAYST
jgi:hypothetical protein